MKLSLAPVPFYWSVEEIRTFYDDIARTPVDIVYLGETVCYKRRGLHLDDWMEIADGLAAQGKEVVLSSLVLVDGEAEGKATRRLCANGRYRIEANDMSAVGLSAGTPFIAGATLNIYNEHTLALIAEAGATRFVAPIELGSAALMTLRARAPSLECEILAFGRPALAYSARCFTARNYDRGKDACERICLDHPEGMLVETQEDEAFLVLNGLQIHAARPLNYATELDSLRHAHIDILRIMPEKTGTDRIIDAFHGLVAGRYTQDQVTTQLAPFAPTGSANGYWRGQAGRLTCL
ncbi:MAG: U32 family peptidase [Gammaproteobacteria bacterium]|nr:U32 family peptidase [Gammaproteobacteria bacterium]